MRIFSPNPCWVQHLRCFFLEGDASSAGGSCCPWNGWSGTSVDRVSHGGFLFRGLDLRKGRVSDCLNKTMEIFFAPKSTWRVVDDGFSWFFESRGWFFSGLVLRVCRLNLPDLFALSIFFEIFHVWDTKKERNLKTWGNCGKIPDQNLPPSIPKISCICKFETSITSSGSVQAGNIMPHIHTVKLCPNVVCWFYSKNGKTTGLFKKDLQRFGWRVKGVCFETVFIHPVKPSSFWANHCTTKPPTRRFSSRGVVYKGTDETKMATADFG